MLKNKKTVICHSVSQRWVLAILTMGTCIISFVSQSGFGVALVAMVNEDLQPSSVNNNYSTNDSQTQNIQEKIFNPPHYNWPRQIQGYILSAYFWGALPLKIFGGTIAQRFGGKWVVAVAVSGVAIFNMLTPLATRGGPIVLLVVNAMRGMIDSVLWPVTFAIYGRWIPPQEMSLLGSFADVGATFGQLIGLVISGPIAASKTLGGWPAVFYTNGAISLTFVIIWCRLVSNSPEDHPCISEEELTYIQESLKSKQEEVNQTGVPWKRILLSRATLCLLIASFGFGWVLFMVMTSMPQYLSDVLHLDIAWNSMLLSLTALPKSVTVLVVSFLSDLVVRREWMRKNTVRKLCAGIGILGTSSVYIALNFAPLDKWIIISLIIVGNGFFWQFSSVVYCIAPLDLTPEYSGTVSGLSNMCVMIGGIVMPMVVDVMTAHQSKAEWDSVFFLTTAVIAPSGLIFILFGTAERQYQWTEDGTNNDFTQKCQDNTTLHSIERGS